MQKESPVRPSGPLDPQLRAWKLRPYQAPEQRAGCGSGSAPVLKAYRVCPFPQAQPQWQGRRLALRALGWVNRTLPDIHTSTLPR